MWMRHPVLGLCAHMYVLYIRLGQYGMHVWNSKPRVGIGGTRGTADLQQRQTTSRYRGQSAMTQSGRARSDPALASVAFAVDQGTRILLTAGDWEIGRLGDWESKLHSTSSQASNWPGEWPNPSWLEEGYLDVRRRE